MKNKGILMIVFGTMICAFAFNIFLSPYEIVPGGVGGISIVLHHLFDWDESLVIAVLSFIFLLIGYIFLGKKEVFKAILGSILFSFFAYLSSYVLQFVDFSIDSRLLSAVVGGVMYGFGIGLVYREGYTTGGGDIAAKIFTKYFHIPMGGSVLIVDSVIAIMGVFVFGFETLIYSALTIYIYSVVIDKVILGISGNKSFYIITNNPNKIKKFITEELHHGVTILKGRGAYTDDDKYLLFVVIPTRDYYRLKDGINKLDQDAFFVVSQSYEVGGGK